MTLTAEDRLDIIETQAHYAAAIDFRDYELFRLAFADDYIATFGGVDDGVGKMEVRGVEAMMEWGYQAHKLLDGTQHHISNNAIQQKDGQIIHRSYSIATLTKNDLTDGVLYRCGAVYYDTMEKRSEGWRIASRDAEVLWQEGNFKIPEIMYPQS